MSPAHVSYLMIVIQNKMGTGCYKFNFFWKPLGFSAPVREIAFDMCIALADASHRAAESFRAASVIPPALEVTAQPGLHSMLDPEPLTHPQLNKPCGVIWQGPYS